MAMRGRVVATILIIFGLVLFTFSIAKQKNSNNEILSLPSGEESELADLDVDIYDIKLTQHENKLMIDKIGVEAEILEGGIETLTQGVWHLPRTSNPSLGGNTVLSAHRWKYRPPDPRTFYDLDKMEIGDVITIVWEGNIYKYVINNIFEVTPNQVEILAPSDTPQLTLFTCTPLFSTARRLVIKANLESIASSTDLLVK